MANGIRGYGASYPVIAKPVYVDELCAVIGNVVLDDHVSVWPHAVLRGDAEPIRVGSWTSIQDNCVVHGKTVIGKRCVVGHGAILHGCTIGDGCLVGMGSIIMNGAEVGDGCIIGAGTLITEGKNIAPGSLVIGSPGKVVRQVRLEETDRIRESVENYWKMAQAHMQ